MSPQVTNQALLQIVKTYWLWRLMWIGTTVVFALLGLFYVLFMKNDIWVASQGLIVRDEANGAVMRLGRFESQSEMKAAQETILEMARNSQVIREALRKVGPRASWFSWFSDSESWPSSGDVESLADSAIDVHAPKGAQFGTTEVIYLDVKQDSRERTVALSKAICEALEHRLQIVRKARADGVITELLHARDTAKKQLIQATEQLQLIERDAGADLSDLRGMTESNSGGNTNLQHLDLLKTEIRQAEHQQHQLLTDLNLLRETLQDPTQLSMAPSSLLQSQPGLKRLREGLADAQLAVSQLQGRYQDSHPVVLAAENSKTEIAAQLQQELLASLQAVERDVDIGQKRIDLLKNQQQQSEARLERLARVRADYGNLVSEVHTRSTILQDAERELAEAQASCDAALSTSLLTRLDEPVLGERPIGPSRSTILGGTTFAGLFFGLGIVFLLTPIDSGLNFGRRASDLQRDFGRRLSDRFPWLVRGDNQAPLAGQQKPLAPSDTQAIVAVPRDTATAKSDGELTQGSASAKALGPAPTPQVGSIIGASRQSVELSSNKSEHLFSAPASEKIEKALTTEVPTAPRPPQPAPMEVSCDQTVSRRSPSFFAADQSVPVDLPCDQTVQIVRTDKLQAPLLDTASSNAALEPVPAADEDECPKTLVRPINFKQLDEAVSKTSLVEREAAVPQQAMERRNKPREEPARTFKPLPSQKV